jgi:hypothetical protein
MEELRQLDTAGWTRENFREYLQATSYAEMRKIIVSWLAQQDKNIVIDMIRQLRVLKISQLEICRWRMEDKYRRARRAELELLMNTHFPTGMMEVE